MFNFLKVTQLNEVTLVAFTPHHISLVANNGGEVLKGLCGCSKCWIVSAWLCVILNMLGSFPVVSLMDMKVWIMLKIIPVCDSCQTESQVVFLVYWDHSPVRKSFKLLEAWAALSVQSSTLQCLVCCKDYIDCILSFTYELSHKRPAGNIHKVKPIRSRMGIRNQAQTMSIQ